MRDITKKVGAKIRALRRLRGLTQEQAAEAAQVNATYLGRIERGEANVSIELLAAIAGALDVHAAALLDEDYILDDLSKIKNAIIAHIEKMSAEQLNIIAILLAIANKK